MNNATDGQHLVSRTLHEQAMYPGHDPRTSSAEYVKTHHHLVVVLDEPCWVCGVRNSTLKDPKQNLYGAKVIETHHYHLEWALANAVDPAKILADFPEMGSADDPHLRAWLDSEGQMLVLCDIHHRNGHYGIHEITYPVWVGQRYFKAGWDLVKGMVSNVINPTKETK